MVMLNGLVFEFLNGKTAVRLISRASLLSTFWKLAPQIGLKFHVPLRSQSLLKKAATVSCLGSLASLGSVTTLSEVKNKNYKQTKSLQLFPFNTPESVLVLHSDTEEVKIETLVEFFFSFSSTSPLPPSCLFPLFFFPSGIIYCYFIIIFGLCLVISNLPFLRGQEKEGNFSNHNWTWDQQVWLKVSISGFWESFLMCTSFSF